MSSIRVGEIRWYEWGDEPAGMVSIWTVNEDRSVKGMGHISMEKVWEKKLAYECPYP
jgi:hypothetical protein